MKRLLTRGALLLLLCVLLAVPALADAVTDTISVCIGYFGWAEDEYVEKANFSWQELDDWYGGDDLWVGAYQVEPMLALEDYTEWDTSGFDFESYVDESLFSTGNRFHLFFGRASPEEAATSSAAKYVYKILVTFSGTPVLSSEESNLDLAVGSDDDPDSNGYYMGTSRRISVDVTAASAQELQSDSVLQALNRSGAVFARDIAGKNGGYPVLWFENGQNDTDCRLTQASAANGAFTVSQTGSVRFGASVSLTAQPAAGYRLAYFTANGSPILGDYYTVTGDTGQAAALLVRFARMQGISIPADAAPVYVAECSAWAQTDVQAAYAAGLLDRFSACLAAPQEAASRAERKGISRTFFPVSRPFGRETFFLRFSLKSGKKTNIVGRGGALRPYQLRLNFTGFRVNLMRYCL